jgi:acetoacetyl-CoA reductase
MGQESSANKIALVTHGIHGIGAAICKTLHSEGYTVIAHHQNDWSLARSFTSETGIPIMEWPLSSWSDCQSAVSDIATHWGHISVLIHHVRAYPNQSLNRTTMRQWQSGVNIPLDGMFALTHSVTENMCRQGYGRIITVGSFHGVCSSKSACMISTVSGGMMGFTKALAHEVGPHGVTANMVATGHIRTDDIDRVCPDVLESCMKSIPLKRMGIPEEIADLVLFLCSKPASFITGSTIHVNGGQWMA